MKRIVVIARVLMGLPLLALGLNGFLGFMEPPIELSPEGLSLLRSLRDTGFLVPLRDGTMALSGLLLLTGLFVPLALCLVAPLVITHCLVHVFLDDPVNGVGAYTMAALELFLVVAYGSYFRGFFRPRPRHRFEKP